MLRYIFILLLMTANNGYSQYCHFSNDKLAAIRTSRSLLYFDSTNKQYGAGLRTDAPSLKIFFYEAKYHPATKKLYISGRVHIGIAESDTFGLGGVAVMLAKPIRSTLTNTRKLCESKSTYKDSIINQREEGLFEFEVKINERDNLYFIAESWYVAEYKLSRIINSCKRKKKKIAR